MEKVTNKNISDITNKTKLEHKDLRKLFTELDIDSNDVENAERTADTRDFKLQAQKVLRMWRENNGRRATRRRILDALEECNFIDAKETLEKKWGIGHWR